MEHLDKLRKIFSMLNDDEFTSALNSENYNRLLNKMNKELEKDSPDKEIMLYLNLEVENELAKLLEK